MTKDWLDSLRAQLKINQQKVQKQDDPTSIKSLTLEEGERRDITILFLDIKGFTAMSEKLDPEQIKFIIDSTFRALTEDIHRYKGFVDKYIGDAIMALFGGKGSDEHSTEQAIRAGFDMLETMKQVNEILEKQGLSLAVRIGINTGLVVTGKVGGKREGDWTVMGDAVNLTQRLESSAEVNTILVSEETRDRTHNTVIYEKQEPITVKGKFDPVSVFRAISIKKNHSNEEKFHNLDIKELVGKTEPLAQILNFLQTPGDIRHLHISADVGLGKSKLIKTAISEFYGNARGQHVLFAEFPSFYSSPFPVFRRWMKSFLQDSTKIENLSSALEHWISSVKQPEFKERMIQQRAIIQFLLDLPEGIQKTSDWEINRLADEVQITLQSFLQIMASENRDLPILCVVEDIHVATARFFSHFVSLMQSVYETKNILFITTSRREKIESEFLSITEKSGIETKKVLLKPFTQSECEQFYPILLQKKVFIDNISSKVLFEKSEGNPLFLAEITYSLRDNGFVEDFEGVLYFDTKLVGFHVPETIHGLLLQKIDKLHEDSKKIIQFASIIGHQFPKKILEKMYNKAHFTLGFSEILEQLIQGRFLQEVKNLQEIKFAHGSVRDATESTILMRNKRKLHSIAAEIGESVFINESPRKILYLAQHWYGAKNTTKAIPALVKALRQVVKNYNFKLGHQIYKNCLEMLDENNPKHFIRLIEVYGLGFQLFDLTGMRDETLNIYQNVMAISEKSQNPQHKLKEEYFLFLYYYRTKQFEQSIQQSKIVLNLLKETNNRKMETELMLSLGQSFMQIDEYKKSKAILTRTIDLSKKTNNLKVESAATGFLAENIRLLGDYKKALDLLQKAIDIAIKIGDKRILLNRYATLGSIYRLLKKYEQSENNYAKSTEIAESLGAVDAIVATRVMRALLYKEKEDFETATVLFEDVLPFSKRIKHHNATSVCYAHLADIAKVQGRLDISKLHYQQSIQIAKETNNPRATAARQRELAIVLMTIGDVERAEITILNSIEIYKKIKVDFFHVAKITHAEIEFWKGNFSKSLKIIAQNIDKLKNNEHQQDAWIEAVVLQLDAFLQIGKPKETMKVFFENQKQIESTNSTITKCYHFLYLIFAEAQQMINDSAVDTTINTIEENLPDKSFSRAPEFYLRLGKIYRNAGNKTRQQKYFRLAKECLSKQSERIKDIEIRKQFLENVPVNKELSQIEVK